MNAEDAFSPTRDRSHFFASSVAEVVLSQLQAGLDHERPVLVVTGEPDVGKSSVVREACARWGARVRAEWLALPGAEPEALLEPIVKLFGGKARGDDTRDGWFVALSRTLGIVAEHDELPLLVVEDAHTLSMESLVELATIHNEATVAKRPLRMILLGTPKLDAMLDELESDPLAQLVGVRCRVTPLPAQDVRNYLHHRIAAKGGDGERVFSRKAARELHTASNGVPGVLDLLAAESIRCARKAGTNIVGQEHVRAAMPVLKRVSAPAATAPEVKPAAAAPKAIALPDPKGTKPARAVPAPAPPVLPAPPVTPAPAPVAPPPTPASKSMVKPPLPEKPVVTPPPKPKPVGLPAVARPKAAKPTPRPNVSRPYTEPSPLDSRHPRVKEWVSRFTEGDTPTRFGARLNLPPITDPDSLPTFIEGESEPPPPPQKPARKSVRESEPVAFTPEPSEPEPIVFAPEPVEMEQIVIEPEPIVLGPDAVSPVHEPEPVKAAVPPAAAKPPAPLETRKQRRQRERDREAAEARAAAIAKAAAPAKAPAAPPAAVPVAATAPPPPPPPTPPKRKVIIEEPVFEEEPELESVGPARMVTGPLAAKPGRFMHVVVPGILMLGVAAVAIWAGTRGGFETDPPQSPTQVSSSAPPEPAPAPAPVVPTTTGPSMPDTATELGLTPSAADSAPNRYSLSVGTYLFSDRARIVSRQLTRRTGLNSTVVTIDSDGGRSYKILLGGFSTQALAEKAADRLLGRGIVSEAMVEPLPGAQTEQ